MTLINSIFHIIINFVILKNGRISKNKQYIESLLLNCTDPYFSGDLVKSLDSSALIPIQLHLSVNSSYYYPGQSLIFIYEITDILGNVFDYNMSHGFRIQLTGIGYSETIEIEANGECPICDMGILINQISIKDNINKLYTFDVAVINNIFYPISSQII